MPPLNHKRTTSSLAPPIFYLRKKFGNEKIEGSQLNLFVFYSLWDNFLVYYIFIFLRQPHRRKYYQKMAIEIIYFLSLKNSRNFFIMILKIFIYYIIEFMFRLLLRNKTKVQGWTSKYIRLSLELY